MKTFSYFKLPLLTLIFCLFFIPHVSEAKSSTPWNYSYTLEPLYYYWDGNFACGFTNTACSGWEKGLQNPTVTINYYADVYNNQTNQLITDGTTVPVGTVLRFTPETEAGKDISWFGVGYSQDSPNGWWVNSIFPYDRSINACSAANYIGKAANSVLYDVYAPLLVKIPTKTITHSGTAGLSCNSGNSICTVTSAGSINSIVSFAATTGHFYYAYDQGGGCTMNGGVNFIGVDVPTVPMATQSVAAGAGTSNNVPYFLLQVPEQTVTFTLTATGGNTAPAAPTINNQGSGGSTSGTANQPINFTLVATDPDNDTIKYGIDWDNIVGVDEWVPTSGFVNSGTSQATTHPWPTSGTYTFQALTQDSNGLSSGWTTHTVNIAISCIPGSSNTTQPRCPTGYDYVNVGTGGRACRSNGGLYVPNSTGNPTTVDFTGSSCPAGYDSGLDVSTGSASIIQCSRSCSNIAVSADLKINNSTGPLNVPKNTSVNIQWSSTNAVSCSKWGGTWGNGETIATSGTDTTVVTTSSTYLVNCGGTVSQVQVNVVNQTPNPPSITYQSGTLQTGQPITFSIQGSDPDTDNIFYEVDWDNDGTPEATSMTVPSNTAQPATHSWTTAGIQTFQARTVDLSGARSTWTPHSETITLAIPNPPASITATCPLPGDTLTAAWSATPGATSYNLRVDNQSNTWDSSCNPSNTPGDYCQDGLTSTSKVVTGTPNATHNLWVHACNAAGCSAPVTIASPVTCVQRPNFTQPAITYTLSPFNTTTGFYDYIDVTFQNTNGGGSNTQANADYQFRYDAGQNGYELTRTGALGLFTVGQSVNKTERVLNVTFGPTRIEVTADNTNAVAETNEADNVRTLDFTVPPPDPGLTITADRVRVRNDETTTIRWNTTTPYPGLTCQVYGPGTNLNPATLPGTVTTQPIKAKSEYTFKCTEATTGTVWSKVATVETEGVIEER